MTFSRPLRINWLIVGIDAFQNDRRLDRCRRRQGNLTCLDGRHRSRPKRRAIILSKIPLSSAGAAGGERLSARPSFGIVTRHAREDLENNRPPQETCRPQARPPGAAQSHHQQLARRCQSPRARAAGDVGQDPPRHGGAHPTQEGRVAAGCAGPHRAAREAARGRDQAPRAHRRSGTVPARIAGAPHRPPGRVGIVARRGQDARLRRTGQAALPALRRRHDQVPAGERAGRALRLLPRHLLRQRRAGRRDQASRPAAPRRPQALVLGNLRSPVSTAPKRLTLLDCVGLGINGIIGTGIFLLPAKVFGKAGGMSWAAWLAIGGLCLLVGLCFCEAAGRTDRNGGPLLYARQGFGRWIGFGGGWMSLASAVFSYGAVARGFGRNLSYLVPALQQTGPQIALALVVIFGLAALNYRGVKPGALVSDFFSGAKLVPLLLFVAVGLFFVDWHRLAPTPPLGETRLEAIKVGGLAALFACTGFEYVPVPAGETDNPRRNVPLALFGALLGSILLYALVQIVFIGTHPNPSVADKPLAEAAGAFLGPWAGRFITLGAMVSSFGYLTAVALVSPRYLSALGEEGELPSVFAR